MKAEDRVRKIKKTLRGKETYGPYTEHQLMQEFGIGYSDLMDFPFEKYLEHSKILSLEKKEEKKENEKQQSKAERKL